MDSSDDRVDVRPVQEGKLRRRIRALGVWGFLFFLVKGLLWLAVPAAIAAWRWLSG
jgi:hypothetical protein